MIGEIHSQIIDTVCPGENNVNYSVVPNLGSTYQWFVAGGTIKSGNGTATIQVDWQNQTGVFSISVIEKNILNCYGVPVYANVLIRGENYKISYPKMACVNDNVKLSGIGGDKYLWNNGDTNSFIRIIQDTSFVLKISNSTCALLSDTFNMNIKAAKGPIVAFSPDDEEFYKDQNIYFRYLGNTSDKVTWIFDKSLVKRLDANNVNVAFSDTGQSIIKLIAVSTFGCVDSLSKTINVKDENLFIPNAFTPNADGLNDDFKPIGHGIKRFRLVIFNRWGRRNFCVQLHE